MTAKLVNETLAVRTSLPESEWADKVLKARCTSEQNEPLV